LAAILGRLQRSAARSTRLGAGYPVVCSLFSTGQLWLLLMLTFSSITEPLQH
jgi:hypothetical protein